MAIGETSCDRDKQAMSTVILIILLFTICNQGGYFPGGIVAVGIAEAIICLIKRPVFKARYVPMLLFCIWHCCCCLRNGFVTEYISTAMLPVDVLLFFVIAEQTSCEKKEIITRLIKYSVVIAAASIVFCFAASVKGGHLQRALFPFQYSNASGLYFGMMFLISDRSEDKLLKKIKYVFAVALLLTQSVGAVFLTVAATVVFGGRNRRNAVLVLCVVLMAAIMHKRVGESVYTFAERLLQISDGVKCIVSHPIFGVGTGYWQSFKPYFQSGFYSAGVIHSGFVQLGVSSGLVGVALLVRSIIANAIVGEHKRETFLVLAVIFIHACFDFSLSFLAIDMLAVLMLIPEGLENEKSIRVNKYLKATALMSVLLVLVSLATGLYRASGLENLMKKRDFSAVAEKYEEDAVVRSSKKARTDYLIALYSLGRYKDAISAVDEVSVKTSEMIILKAWCGEKEVLIEALREQPYNKSLYEEARKGENTQEIEKIYEKAIENMSFWGKILYSKKGEN